jgi:hypothetical protein
MALAGVQTVLARLFTDAPFRASFFENPIAIGRSSGLDPAEAQVLAALSRDEVEQFAATLRRKRADDICAILPLTARALGAAFGDHVQPAIAGAPRARRHRDDARALVNHLACMARSQQLELPWAADLARYEVAFKEVPYRRACLLVRRFHFPIAALAAAIVSGAPIADVKPRATVGIWLRWPGRRGFFHWVW